MEAPQPSAKSTSVPGPQFLDVPGIFNFRDLGGYGVPNSGKSIRQKIIYRCGEPNHITATGIQTLNGLGITHVYDLRSEAELAAAKLKGHEATVEWEGCERVFVPVFRNQAYDPESLAVSKCRS